MKLIYSAGLAITMICLWPGIAWSRVPFKAPAPDTASLIKQSGAAMDVEIAPPVTELIEQLQSLQTLATLKLTADQLKTCGGIVSQFLAPNSVPVEVMRPARDLNTLLQKERDIIMTRQTVPEWLPDSIDKVQESQYSASLYLNKCAARIAQALFFSLTPGQREVLAKIAPAHTDAAIASQLTTLSQSPAVQFALLQAVDPTPDASTSTTYPWMPSSELASLQRLHYRFLHQIQFSVIYTAFGITSAESDNGGMYLARASRYFQQRTRGSDTQSVALISLIRKAAVAIGHGDAIPSEALVIPPAPPISELQVQSSNAIQNTELAVFAMVTAMPPAQQTEFITPDMAPTRYTQVALALSTARTETLPVYVAAELATVHSLRPTAYTPAIDLKIQQALRQCRLMSEAEFLNKAPGMIHSLVSLGVTPVDVSTMTGLGGKPLTAEQQNEKTEDLENLSSKAFARVIYNGYLLDVILIDPPQNN